VQDDEQVVVVRVDLGSLVARQHVLEVEGVEVELLLQPGALDRRGALDVDPPQARALNGFDLGGALALLSGRDELGAAVAAQPGLWKARHRCSSRSLGCSSALRSTAYVTASLTLANTRPALV
jgi:hypothetical protein